jgi:hypothetical protein
MESILTSIKKMLGITEEYKHFDTDIIIHINTALMTLSQLGSRFPKGFAIKSEDDLWSDFVSDDTDLESVKSYVYLKVKLLFDPPTSSAVIESINRQLSELEWRINVAADDENND